MSNIETVYTEFECPIFGGTVTITQDFLLHLDQQGNVDRRVIQRTDCEGKVECGVGTIKGTSIHYDWGKCVHPNFNR